MVCYLFVYRFATRGCIDLVIVSTNGHDYEDGVVKNRESLSILLLELCYFHYDTDSNSHLTLTSS
jgi:hypothetical protein